MNASETSGLASYKQTVSQTPGLASSVWAQGTALQMPILVQVVPMQYLQQEKEQEQEKTA